jgi:transcriptional regulator with XRE-family HTH domain
MREFLTSRRARITPEQAGLQAFGNRRRVTGLRREEVATLAGISVEYYTQLERGNARGASDDVLDAVARALQLDDAERTHLFDLARTSGPSRVAQRRPAQQRVRPTIQLVLDAIKDTPAIIRNTRLDILATNPLGHALYSTIFESTEEPPNFARYSFLDSSAGDFFVNWASDSSDCVALLRAQAGRDPFDRDLSDLVGELSTRSDEFRIRWASHNVKLHRTGPKVLHHQAVGEITLHSEAFELPTDPGQVLVVYTTEPNSPSRQAINLLAIWSASHDTTTPDEPPTNASSSQQRPGRDL